MSDLAEITENNDDCLIVDKETIQLTSGIFDKFEPYRGVGRTGETFNFIGALLPKFLTNMMIMVERMVVNTCLIMI